MESFGFLSGVLLTQTTKYQPVLGAKNNEASTIFLQAEVFFNTLC